MSQSNVLIRPSSFSLFCITRLRPSTGMLSTDTSNRLKWHTLNTDGKAFMLQDRDNNRAGDCTRLLRQLLLSKGEHTASLSRASMDAVPLRNEGVVSKCAVVLTSNVSDCSLGSSDQLTQSRKRRVIKQAREKLANPQLRDSRCLT
jgi:hypothetical protein